MMRRFLFVMLFVSLVGGSLAAQEATPEVTPAATPEAEAESGVPAYLGISFDAADNGVTVVQVVPASPAANAGLQQGDIITAVNGEAVSDETLAAVIGMFAPGDSITLTIARGGNTQDIDVTLGERPSARQPRNEVTVMNAYVGITLVARDGQVVISEVVEGSPAADAGLMADDVIIAVEGEAVSAIADLRSMMGSFRPGDELAVTVERDGETLERTVLLGEPPTLGFRLPNMEMLPMRSVAYLGVSLGEPVEDGIPLIEIVEGSPAAEAGLQVDDVITAVNGQAVSTAQEVQRLIRGMDAGDDVTITVVRGGETLEIGATLAETTLQAFMMPFQRRDGGFEGSPFDMIPFGEQPFRDRFFRDMRGAAFRYDADAGGYEITALAENSAYYEDGLRAGDMLTALNGESLADGLTLRGTLRDFDFSEDVTVTVLRDGETLEITTDGALRVALLTGGLNRRDGSFRLPFTPERPGNRPSVPRGQSREM